MKLLLLILASLVAVPAFLYFLLAAFFFGVAIGILAVLVKVIEACE